jgi:hypothetical protein
MVPNSFGKSKGFSNNAFTPETSDGKTGLDRAVIKMIGNSGCPAMSCCRFFHASSNGALKSSTARSTLPEAVLCKTSRPLLACITKYPSSVRTRNNIRRTAESSSASRILFFIRPKKYPVAGRGREPSHRERWVAAKFSVRQSAELSLKPTRFLSVFFPRIRRGNSPLAKPVPSVSASKNCGNPRIFTESFRIPPAQSGN